MIEYKTIEQFASESGYTAKAIRAKISRGVFRKDEVWVCSPDNRVLIYLEGFNEWVRKGGQVLLSEVEVVSTSVLPTKILNVEKEYARGVSPLVLT